MRKRTQYDRDSDNLRAVKEALNRLFRESIKDKVLFSEIHKKRNILYGYPTYQKLPKYMKEQLTGYYDCFYTNMLWTHVEWRLFHPVYGYVNSEYMRQPGLKYSDLISEMGMHFWENSDRPISCLNEAMIKYLFHSEDKISFYAKEQLKCIFNFDFDM